MGLIQSSVAAGGNGQYSAGVDGIDQMQEGLIKCFAGTDGNDQTSCEGEWD